MNYESAREAETLRLIRSMLSYLVQHSDAMDTADGIRQWWLPLNCEYTLEQVQEALDDLVAKKWLIALGSGEELKLYSLNKDRLTEVMVFISGRTDTPKDKVQ